MMEARTLARISFQVLAFGMFVFQMQNSVRKYIAKPVVQHTLEGNLLIFYKFTINTFIITLKYR